MLWTKNDTFDDNEIKKCTLYNNNTNFKWKI